MDQITLSWLYYIVFTVYVATSSFMALRRPHSAKANLLTLIFAAASVWALCLSFATIAPDITTSLLWRRVGVLGWGTIFSYILHIALISTGFKKFFTRRWIYMALYLPAVINVIFFLLVGESANQHFNLRFSRFGWMNTWVDTFANWFHAIYYALYIGLSILLFLLWSFKTKDPGEKKQGKGFMLSLFVAAFLGSLTDFINIRTYQEAPPQLGIVFVLFPAMVSFYLISKYDFLGTGPLSEKTNFGIFSDKEGREKLYEWSAFLLLFASFFNLANRVLVMRDFSSLGFWVWGVLQSALLLLGGTAVIHARRLGISLKAQRWILIVTILIGLSVSIYTFSTGGDGFTWELMFLVFMVALVFGKPIVLLAGVLAQTAIQFYLVFNAGFEPKGERLTGYALRVIAIGAGVYFIYYVNRVYQTRLQESREKTRFQSALLALSRNLQARSGIPEDASLTDAMDIIAGYLKCCRAGVLLFQNGDLISSSFSQAKGKPPAGSDSDLCAIRAVYLNLLAGYEFVQVGQSFCIDIKETHHTPINEHMKQEGLETISFSPFLVTCDTVGLLLVERKTRLQSGFRDCEEFSQLAGMDLSNYLLRALAEKELKSLAFKDPLTGFFRREQSIAKIEERIKSHQPGELIALLFIDVDNFKSINDTAGHHVGNQVISIIGERFRAITRPQDVLGRFGGDEFLCLTTQSSRHIIEDIAERLLSAFSQPIAVESKTYMLSASIGIAVYPLHGQDADTLLRKADIAMYYAKFHGKGLYQFYSPSIENTAVQNHINSDKI